MPLQHLFIIYLIGTLIVFLPAFGFYKLFQKAGAPAWKAFVPFYNTWVMQELAHRPKHWVFWQLIPVGGWFISMGIFIEFAKIFGKFSFLTSCRRFFTCAIIFPIYRECQGHKVHWCRGRHENIKNPVQGNGSMPQYLLL